MDVKSLADSAEALSKDSARLKTLDETERKRLLGACNKLTNAVETSFEKTLRILFSGHQTIGLRLAVDVGIFDVAQRLKDRDDTAGRIALEELSAETSADELLLRRIMRVLVGMRMFEEVEPAVYVPLDIASAYQSSSPLSAAVIHVSHLYVVLSQLPEYFAENGWHNPDDVYDGPFQYTMRTKMHYFDFLAEKPYYQKAFNTVMTISQRRKGRPWFSFFPIEQKLSVDDESDVLLVDVGGSQGGDIKAFHEAFPELKGRLVLQDLPVVVKDCKDLPSRIEVMPYDFFSEQPIKGAKTYFLRTVLHEWPEKQALRILEGVAKAMTANSILLISETVLPEQDAALSSAQADLTMMVSFASLERTRKQFEELLNEAGFDLIGVWVPEGFHTGSTALLEQATLLEAKLKT
ncbi:hypothetical protein KC333_g2825 [Hortaea werneckii]|nr:hypothetical protein KC333_g2825 [Hortaea werneckii]KAI7323915.1 hypothetical protein KC326_g1302 [Hortaea werneckii]